MAEAYQGRIGIIGAGALGCFYGAKLFDAGFDVHFLMRRDYDAVSERGMRIFSIDGDFSIRPPIYPSAEELGFCDLIIVGLKSTDNGALAGLLAPTADENTLVLTMQNGLGNEEAVERALNELGQPDAGERILGGTAFLCSHRGEPGVVHHTDHGWVRLAEYRGAARERTQAIAEMFRHAGVRCEVMDSLLEARWRKLVWNIPFNGLGVAAGDTRVVLDTPALKAAARGLMEEVLAAAKSDGIEIESDFIEQMIASTETMGPYKSSMQIDFENRRPLEVEAILGEPLRRAQHAGFSVPRMEMLFGIIHSAAETNAP